MRIETDDNARLLQGAHFFRCFKPLASCYGDLAGPLAMMTCELRQARKGATVAVSYVPGCGWLDCLHSHFYTLIPLIKIPQLSP